MTATTDLHVLALAAELAKAGKAYIPRLDATAAACERHMVAGLMTRAWADLNGREVYAYSLTPAGAARAACEAQP